MNDSGGPAIFSEPTDINAEFQKAMDEHSAGWDFFKNQFLPAVTAETFRPDDKLLIEISQLAETDLGRRLFAWLHELTDRAPYPAIGGSLEAAALAAAKHQGRAGVGLVLEKAVRTGRELRERAKG